MPYFSLASLSARTASSPSPPVSNDPISSPVQITRNLPRRAATEGRSSRAGGLRPPLGASTTFRLHEICRENACGTRNANARSGRRGLHVGGAPQTPNETGRSLPNRGRPEVTAGAVTAKLRSSRDERTPRADERKPENSARRPRCATAGTARSRRSTAKRRAWAVRRGQPGVGSSGPSGPARLGNSLDDDSARARHDAILVKPALDVKDNERRIC
jgi:hypothetical protein